MKSLLLAVLITGFCIFCGCQDKQNENFRSTGKITGPDYRECACCGGYYIKIDTSMYEFYSLPKNADFSLENANYPVFVKLDWDITNNACGGINHINILKIKKVE